MIKFLSPILGMITSLPWYMWAIGLSLGLAMCNGHRYRAIRDEFDTAKSDAVLERKASEIAAAQEGSRRKTVIQGASDEAAKKIQKLQSNLATSALVAQQLREQLSSAQAASCAGDPASAAGRSASGATSDLSAYVSRRLDEAADGVAEFAERSFVSSDTCNTSYLGLTVKSPKTP